MRALSDNGLFGSNGVLNLGNRLGVITRHLLLFSLGQGPRNEIKILTQKVRGVVQDIGGWRNTGSEEGDSGTCRPSFAATRGDPGLSQGS